MKYVYNSIAHTSIVPITFCHSTPFSKGKRIKKKKKALGKWGNDGMLCGFVVGALSQHIRGKDQRSSEARALCFLNAATAACLRTGWNLRETWTSGVSEWNWKAPSQKLCLEFRDLTVGPCFLCHLLSPPLVHVTRLLSFYSFLKDPNKVSSRQIWAYH